MGAKVNRLRLVLFILLLAGGLACAKDHSVEGRPAPVPVDSLPPVTDTSGTDSLPPASDSLLIAGCALCVGNASLPDSSWQFQVNGRWLCGSITGVVASNDRQALTFYGPSYCSSDSGLIINAYFTHNPLTESRLNVKADWASAIYYDNVKQRHAFESLPANGFALNLQYDAATGNAFGELRGNALFAPGIAAPLVKGRFKFTLKP